jgi:hypothetical protein
MRYRALLAAIDDYGNPRNNLPSCVNDLGYVDDCLRTKLKVPGSRIRKLVNSAVTTQALAEGLEWLTRDAAEDERLLFFFSGHGYQLAGGGGSVDEALVLSGNEFFLDDKLVESSKAAKPGTLTVLLDCCFGGGNDKFFLPTGTFGELARPKRWSPPDDFVDKQFDGLAKGGFAEVVSYRPFGCLPITAKAKTSVVFSESGLTPWPTAVDEAGQPSINGALLAACLEDETASASTAQTQGLSAFTFALKRVVEQRGIDLTLGEARDSTDEVLKKLGFRQTSTLKIGSGPIDRDSRLFSLERKSSATRSFVGRSIDMTDTKFLEVLVPILVDRVARELSKKGYAPINADGEKFFPGFVEVIVPALVNRAIDELTKKGYAPMNGAADKSLGGDIVRDIIERVTRELIGKGYTPAPASPDKFLGMDAIAPIVIDRVLERFVR